MTSLIGDFELRGADGDETRLVVHPRLGYALAIPGEPRLVTPTAELPRYDAVLALAGSTVEVGLRMDEVQTAIAPAELAPALALAYATSRSADPSSAKLRVLDRKVLAPGANAGARVSYALRGDVPEAMEFLALTAKAAGPVVHALHMTVRYRRGETTPFEWASLRSALLSHQSWIPGVLPSATIWPASTFAAPSVKLVLSAAATAEAQAKAEAVGHVPADEVERIADLLLELAAGDDAPSTPMHTFVHDIAARRVAACVSSRVADVLLRNIADTATVHDLRAWSWQCFWAIGNRAELRATN